MLAELIDLDLNYLDKVAIRLDSLLDDCPTNLLRLYALLTLTVGENVTAENVHDAWAVWRTATRPDHPAVIPFAELAAETQARGKPYAAAIRKVAIAIGKPAPEPEPQLPEGVYARVEMPGYRQHEGWVTEETVFGVQVARVRDFKGQVLADVVLGPGCRILRLDPNAKVPARTPLAITTGDGYDPNPYDDDEDRY